jgi:hypothetical protein
MPFIELREMASSRVRAVVSREASCQVRRRLTRMVLRVSAPRVAITNAMIAARGVVTPVLTK